MRNALILGGLVIVGLLCMVVCITGCEKKSDVVEIKENEQLELGNADDIEKEEKTSKEESKEDDEFKLEEDGEFSYKINTEIKIKDYIDVEFPDSFKQREKNEYMYSYYIGEKSAKPDVTVKIGEVDAKSSEKIIKDVVKANDLSEDDDMYSVEINDIIWYIAGYESDDKVVYYNSFESEGKVFLYRYDVNLDITDEDILKTYEDIIESIKIKKIDLGDEENSNNEVSTSTEKNNSEIGAYVDIGTKILDLDNIEFKGYQKTHPKSDWRLLYKDEKGTWLILSSYLQNNKFDVTTVGLKVADGESKDAGVLIDEESNREAFLAGLNNDNWINLINESSVAKKDGVIVRGAMDLELFTNSWNSNEGYEHLNIRKTKSKADGVDGYYIYKDGESEDSLAVLLLDEGYIDSTLYFPHIVVPSKCSGYWLASAGGDSESGKGDYLCMLSIAGTGNVYSRVYNSYKGNALRPVVFLPADIKLDESEEIFTIAE